MHDQRTNGHAAGQAPAFADWVAKAGALGLKRQGRELVGPCPACGGTDRFAIKPAGGGAALIHCRQCKGFLDILKAAGFAEERATNGARRDGTTIREFPYLRADDTLMLTVCRREGPDGKKCGDPPIWRKPKGVKGPLPLYRLPDVLARADLPVLMVEGEKTADCGADLFGDRYAVTTSAGGAGKAGQTDLSPLAGRDVVIWPDADDEGRKHADAIARQCGAASMRIVPTDDLPDKWDLADPAPAGLDIEERLENAFACPIPYKAGQAKGKAWTRYADLIAEPRDATEWEVRGLIPIAGTGLIVGPAKAGKSTMAQTLACHHAAGRPFLGREVRQGHTLYIGHEGSRAALAGRLQPMGGAADLPLTIYHGPKPDEPLAFLADGIEATGATLAVIDPLFRLFDFPDGNDYASVTASTAPLIELAESTGCALVFVHHARKGGGAAGEEALGSTAIFGSVDTMISVKRTDDARTAYSIQREGVDMPETLLTLGDDGTIDLGRTRRDAEDEEARQNILEFLADCGDKAPTRDDIEEALKGRASRTRRVLARLVQDGEIVRHGEGRKGHPYRFTLPDSR